MLVIAGRSICRPATVSEPPSVELHVTNVAIVFFFLLSGTARGVGQPVGWCDVPFAVMT